MSVPKTIIPAQAATHRMRRPATWRSYRGNFASRCRIKKAVPAATAMAASPSASSLASGAGAKLIASTIAATNTTDKTPPSLSTGSVVSLTWLGTKASTIARATAARGNVIKKTEPHQKCNKSQPEIIGPSEEMAPPVPDHSAIDFVRAGPDHSAVMNARVVGKAIPAERPPRRRATTNSASKLDKWYSYLVARKVYKPIGLTDGYPAIDKPPAYAKKCPNA